MRTRLPTAVLERRGSFDRHPERRRAREGEPIVTTRLGDPPDRLSKTEKDAWREMKAEGFWLTAADQFMVEIAATLMAQHRAGTIDNPARSLLVTTMVKLGFGPTERSKLKVLPEKSKPTPLDDFV